MPVHLWTAHGSAEQHSEGGGAGPATCKNLKYLLSGFWQKFANPCSKRIHREQELNARDQILTWVSCFKDKPTRGQFAGIHQQPTSYLGQ